MNGFTGSVALRYGIAILATLMAVGVRLVLTPVLGAGQVPYITLFATLVFVGWYGGRGPGLLSLMLGAAAAFYFILPPQRQFSIGESYAVAGLLLFLLVGAACVLLGDAFQRLRRRAEEQAQLARAGQALLERQASERNQAGEALRESEERYRAVVENQAEMLCRFQPDGKIIFVNGAYARARGATPAALMGRNFWEFVAAEDHAAVRAMLDRLTPQAPEVQIENRFETADGVRWTLWTNRVLKFDVEGRWIEAQSAGIDITERKEAEEKLRESEQRYRGLMALLPAAVYTCEAPSGVITFYNDRAAELWGRAPKVGDTDERFCGSFKLYRPDGAPLPHAETPMAVTVREGRQFRNEEVVIERPDGTRITVLVNIDPIRDGTGQLAGAINVFQDVTALKQVERERAELMVREREARKEAETLNEVARTLAAELDLEKLVQKGTDAATQLTGAKFGAFFYNVNNQEGESYLLYTLSGAPREAFEKFGLPRNTPVFEHTFTGKGVVRSHDITKHKNYGKNPPHHGMPEGHLPVRSYLATPVISRSGAVVGGLFFGHPDPGIFTERAERLATGIAAQAAIAIDNARLFAAAQKEISERKEVEKAKARLAAIVESSEDAIIGIDLDGTITSWNRGAERLYGYTAQDAIRQPVGILIPLERLDEEPNLLARIRGGERIEHYETVRRRKDGLVLDVSLTVSPIADEAGLVVGASKIARNITARKKAEAKLRESEERFRRMADGSPVMIWMTDAEGRASFLNRTGREYFGKFDDQPAAFDWSRSVHPEDRDGYLAAFKTALQQRQTFHQRLRLRRFDGQWRWFESRGNPILDDAGNMVAFIGSSADITEIYESEQASKELAQRKDEFLANMSHEIRSPLTGIMGYADILLSKLKDPEDIHYLKTIKQSGDYLIEIVNDILDLSKIEAGKLVLNIETVSPHAVLGEIHGLMDLRAREKKLPLILRYDGVVPESIQTDRTRLRQIMINLVSNAIKFTDLGRVEIVARFLKDDGLLQVEVIDTGIGIAPEHQARLFEPFTQADSSSKRQYGGTGLGLRITRRLIEMLGGSISFESEPNQGSTFRVTIPSGTAETAAASVSAGAEIQSPLDGLLPHDCHVLVVDDRSEIRNLITHFIKKARGRATAVADGYSAIQTIRSAEVSDPIHVVIMDIQMPRLDGYEVTRQLRAEGFRKPIIALTANAMKGDREKCLAAGCDDYLSKPIDGEALLRVIALHARRAAHGPASGKDKVSILLVDDSQVACEMMRRFLEKRGHEIYSAHDGRSALQLAQEFRPDVVILDISLPDMNGYELMRRLKEIDGIGSARFIAVSGYRDGEAPGQGSIGFDHFLEKPLDMTQLDGFLQS